MNREKLIGAGKQYAPTLYTVLVNVNDNRKLFGFYPTMAAEIETYLLAKGSQNNLKFDGRPLVRFIVDDKLKSGKFDVIAETVAAPIIAQLRDEELAFYGLAEEKPAAAPAADPLGGMDAAGIAGAGAGVAGIAGGTPSTPLAGSRARLTNINAGKSYALTEANVVLGRDSSCDIAIDDANISRRHAQLARDVAGTWKLIDLGSTNGTQLNGRPVTTALLRDGDQITVGITVLEFRED
jgi:hypothetical protein